MRTKCLACDRPGAFWTQKSGRDVWRCSTCKLVWVPDGLLVDDTGATIYEGDTPIFLKDGNERYYLDETNLISARAKLSWVREHAMPGGALLDVGANFGHFLSVAREPYRAVGVELSSAAVAWSRKHFDVQNYEASIYEMPAEIAGPYDVVTLFDVIEHIPDPHEALAALRRVLRAGGVLAISTPDTGSAVARLMGPRWHYLDPVQHIVLFDRTNLSSVLDRAGFDVVEVRSLGHHYRVGYIADRLAYLNPSGLLGRVTKLGQSVARPVAERSLQLNFGDVMGLIARAR